MSEADSDQPKPALPLEMLEDDEFYCNPKEQEALSYLLGVRIEANQIDQKVNLLPSNDSEMADSESEVSESASISEDRVEIAFKLRDEIKGQLNTQPKKNLAPIKTLSHQDLSQVTLKSREKLI